MKTYHPTPIAQYLPCRSPHWLQSAKKMCQSQGFDQGQALARTITTS